MGIDESSIVKTVTISFDDTTYEMIEKAARRSCRSVEEFVESAMLFLMANSQVTDEEMAAILQDTDLLAALDEGRVEYRTRRTRTIP